MIPKFEHRFPGLDGPALSSSYAGCYDVTPDYNPIISASSARRPVALCRFLAGTATRSRPSVGELMADLIIHRQEPASMTSTTATFAGSGSPSMTIWSARILTPARADALNTVVPHGSSGVRRGIY